MQIMRAECRIIQRRNKNYIHAVGQGKIQTENIKGIRSCSWLMALQIRVGQGEIICCTGKGALCSVQFYCTYLLTYLLQAAELFFWEANRFSEIPRILWNPKVHHRIQKCPPPVPILSQLDPVHAPDIPLPEDPS